MSDLMVQAKHRLAEVIEPKTPTGSPILIKSDMEKGPSEVDTEEGYGSEYTIDKEAERRLVRRLDLRIIPLTMLIYLLCFLDRSNIGNAKVLNADTGNSLAQTLGISNQQYLNALMVFVVSYCVFETPSNYMLKKFKPSRWLALLMFAWGVMTLCLGAVSNFGSLVAVRFLLGAFEAGLFPGMVYFLTFWYTARERASGSPLSSRVRHSQAPSGGNAGFAEEAQDDDLYA
ncbi:hypothetical protein EWM64_g2820 [Hericium alpestre]|uniref:Major facilitator superfamily (MFS) profile domain-containing protein n=1 Tax=Hericium alpestre TaxID=135208 RepID=A0A4Z0A4D7_9AGAM|nr:hypothetical protein EWM64_g2820 [Hericium alpestre]